MLLLDVVGMANVGSRKGTIIFLAVSILLGSILSGCFGAEEEVTEDLPPVLDDHGSIPESMTEGDVDRIEVELTDEDIQTVMVEVSVDDNPVGTEFAIRYDESGNEKKYVVVFISDLAPGFHKIRISAEDESGQRTTWLALLSIVENSEDDDVHDGTDHGNQTTGDQGNQTTGDQGNQTTGDQGNETGGTPEEWWSDVLLCDQGSSVMVDDYNTTDVDDWQCEVSYAIDSGNITISTNGLPNHDFHSGPGCCASPQTSSYTIPLEPTDDPDCDPSISVENCTMAPERGAIAFAVNGIAIYGPEDGPGGDAVAGQEGAYEEDRQNVWLGLCHGHSGPGGEYHYHADGNCMHWHNEEGQSWLDYSIDSSRNVTEHSPIVGFAFDGYPIYGFVGWDENGTVKEMKSSYRLKDGENGYNGIDDYEYVQGMGDLDSCNGQFGITPEFPNGTYHYHTTWENGVGGIGFPYFINCYRGELLSGGDGDDDPCAGGPPDGDVWGPGIGPPPEGCDGGQPPGQMDSSSGLVSLPIGDLNPKNGLLPIFIAVSLLFVVADSIKAGASSLASRDRAGIADGCHPTPELA
jgi:hypothetical protein